MPAHPTPAMARPTIRATEVGAMPQIKEPNSKMVIAAMYTLRRIREFTRGDEENLLPFYGQKCVESSPEQLERRGGEKISDEDELGIKM